MRAEHILPIHWGTFPGEEKPDDPINRFRAALSSDPERIALEQIGQTWKSSRGD